MRVVVTGSRGWTDQAKIVQALVGVGTAELIHGGAHGADRICAEVAKTLGWTVTEMRANWVMYGKAAGFIRNEEMLDTRPDLVLAFWDGQSRGTKHTIDKARERGIPVRVIT